MRLSVVVLTGALISTDAAAVSFPGRVPDDQEVPSLAPMLEQVAPAVVRIATIATQQHERSSESGVVIDARQGYVVTSSRPINHADEITATLSDGRVLQATRIGVDSQLDLAVLKVAAGNLSQVSLADSALRVGDFVVAVGNPDGDDQAVALGIVTALGGNGYGAEGDEDFIRTSASISPDSLGGALVDLRGDLVGINVAVPTPAGGNVGVGYAIPSNTVSAIVARLIERGTVQHAMLGIRVQPLNAELAKSFNVALKEGVIVVAVDKASAAAKAGIVPGDVIVEFNGRDIKRVADFREQAMLVMTGDSVDLTVSRGGGSKRVAIDAQQPVPPSH